MNPFQINEEEELNNMTFPPENVQTSLLDQLQAARGFTQEKETGLRDDISKAAPGAAASFLASFGAGLAGNSQAGAMQALNRNQDSAKARLDEYLASKRNVLTEANAERQLAKSDTESQRDMAENDATSNASKVARDSLKAIVPGGNIPETMTAAQVRKVFPGYEKAADLKARNEDRMASREERRSLAEISRDDRKAASEISREDKLVKEREKKAADLQELETPFGIARTTQDAKDLKTAYETKTKFDRALEEMIGLRKKHGVEFADREAVDRGRQLSKDLLLMYKDIAKLGILSAADEKILNAIIPADPLEFSSSQLVGQDSILNNMILFKNDKNAEFDIKLKTRLKDGSTQPPQVSTFPRQVRNAQGEVATVGSEEELKEATAEGFS